MPKSAVVEIDKEGNLLKNGKPHYFLGMQIGNNLSSDLFKVKDTPQELSWIYDEPLDYESAQRLGFDTLSSFNIPTHIQQFGKDLWHISFPKKNIELYNRILNSQLPFYLDFSEFADSNGAPARKKLLPEDAINQYALSDGNHFFAYNPNHPMARAVFKAMIEDGIKRTLASKSPVLAYELFNEPAYNDPSPYNRKLFAQYLERQYGTIDALNKNYGAAFTSFEEVSQFKRKTDHPGVFVDWSKFLEKCFTDYVAFGKKIVQEADPNGRVTVQIMGYDYYRCLPKSNINMYDVSKITNAVTVPTGGGVAGLCTDAPSKHAIETPLSTKGEGLLMRHLYRNFSEGKVQIDSELYCGHTLKDVLNAVWLDYLRGASASYLFSWGKRGWEWNQIGGKRLAEMYQYSLLNPYANPPELLCRYRKAKNEITAFDEFFASRDRNVKREVAVLLSFPTERYAGVTGNTAKNDITVYTSALEFAHYPIDAIVEEQLPGGKANQYKAIVACGTSNIYPATVKALHDYVSNGGILILGRAAMQNDEYGNKIDWNGVFDGLTLKENPVAQQESLVLQSPLVQPKLLPGAIKARGNLEIADNSSWQKLAFIGKRAAVACRKLNKGFIYFIAPEMQDYPAAAVLESILERHDIRPLLELKMEDSHELAVNVETHVSRRGNQTVVFCMNYDNYPKLVYLNMEDLKGKKAYDLLEKKELPVSSDGALFLLPAGTRAIVGIGPKNSFGQYPPVIKETLARLCDEETEKIKETLASKKGFSYSPDLARTVPINMRKFYNRHFLDSVAGDGKGGWTDQGADNSLDGVPWGISKFAGVPCEIVRFDQNDDKTCLVMASKSIEADLPVEVKGIPVNRRIKALYFFHCAAWSEDGLPAMTYRINFADNSHADHKTVVGKNIFDWWISHKTKNLAWKNTSSKGFQVDRWMNPNPEKEVASIDIISANNQIVPIVIAITAEEVDPSIQICPWPLSDTGGFGVETEVRDSAVVVSVDDDTGDWSGLNIGNHAFQKNSADFPAWDKGFLVFEMKGGPDRYGNSRDIKACQMFFAHRDEEGKLTAPSDTVQFPRYAEGGIIPADSFTTIRVPLKRFRWKAKNKLPINTIVIQFSGDGTSAGGFSVRNVRFEIPIQ